MSETKKCVCFGEVLMDNFPSGKVVGGAPMNVAIWLAKLGQQVSMISGVGEDEDGNILVNYMQSNGLNINLVQVNPEYKTGIVEVFLDQKGSATYEISYPVAWDKIAYTEAMGAAVQDADAFFYSTLPARDEVNFSTICQLLERAKYKVLDVNLRPPHYSETVLQEFCMAADFIKFNDDELFEIAALFGSTHMSLEDNALFMAAKTNTPSICVTKGKHGAMVLHQGQFTYFSGYSANVVDTVGAGDSFLASFMSKFLNGAEVLDSIKFGCAVGAFVASNRGANPSIIHGELDEWIGRL